MVYTERHPTVYGSPLDVPQSGRPRILSFERHWKSDWR
jgi:hypothetical protein